MQSLQYACFVLVDANIKSIEYSIDNKISKINKIQ